jgi:CDP-diacylglycerol--glycerol-3-phosphate 3-phosphatidyltransferase/cardiolipin synthase
MATAPTARAAGEAIRLSDLWLVPNLLSLARIPLGLAFPFAVESAAATVAVLVVAAMTDVADGWYARKFDQVTPVGAIADGIADKVFVLCIVLTLLSRGSLGVVEVLALGIRDIGEGLLLAWLLVAGRTRRPRPERVTANALGKAATLLQFAAVVAALAVPPYKGIAVAAAGVVGFLAAMGYIRREIAPLASAR